MSGVALIGTTIDKYDVLQKVGEGGMATVYRGRHSTLNRDVAIKVLHPHLSASTRNRQRFAREARAIEHLRHTNILEIFDYSGATGGDCYIVTEFVCGETLSSLIDRCGPMPSEVAALVCIPLARALHYAHESGVLHRDLKPDNVMVRDDGMVKLMDFGIARFLDESQVTMTGALVGSPAFMSPEQAREDNLDRRSDLFSLGTLLFFLVTGQLPFTGSNASLILKNIIEGNRREVTELVPNISATLGDLIESLLSVQRDDRPPTAASALEQLQEVLADTGLNPSDPRWILQRFFEDPTSYSQDLEQHLLLALPACGRTHLEAGNHLAALRLFNRLLSMDDENSEVISMVQGLHGGPRPRRSIKGLVLVGGIGVLLIVFFGLWSLFGPRFGETQALDAEPSGTLTIRRPILQRPTESAQSPSVVEEPTEVASEGTKPVLKPEPPPVPTSPVRVTVPSAVVRTPDARVVDVSPDPEPPPEKAENPTNPAGRFGYLDIRVRNGWAEVYIDDVAVRRTRVKEPLRLAPGVYTVELRSQYIEPYRLEEVAVVSGETTRLHGIELIYKPLRIRFDSAWDAACDVRVNGVEMGTIGDHNGLIVQDKVPGSLVVWLTCGEAPPVRRVWDALPSLDVDFGPPEDL